ncbi:unnamed protein product [Arctia plantaginis]|uniref:Integrin beta n=1 Tax=Arctia plantaginis TaxID=874455 RepID=A0A8S1AK99_ARCPL|nr:unnamed protein product [Arctia plantaginis]
MFIKIFLVLVFRLYYVSCETGDECNFKTCGACISSAHDICVWCPNDKFAERRCMPLNVLNTTKNWCNNSYIKSHPNLPINIRNDDFNNSIQLRPQRIKIKTSPRFLNKFPIYFKPAEDYPLDVYYLIDISYTMKYQKSALETQAKAIYAQLSDYTNNVKLGIGSFVEKPGFPYVDRIRPTNTTTLSHAFKNHLSLTKNVSAFENTIKNIKFGANYDDPESGLDGLMQAMICKDELQWRNDSRRIIVLCTDSTYHSAGDGKIVGAIKPNDMKCHLDNDLYNETFALTYDYPSISQIDKVAREGQFIIVFATKESVSTEYNYLAKDIFGAKHAVLDFENDAVKIIKDAYLEYATKAELHYFDKLPKFVELTFDQNCYTKPKRNCESTPEQRTVSIEGNLIVKYCPPDNEKKHEIVIHPIGIKDSLVIELEIDCQCDCEKEISTNTTSPVCHNAGFIQCGICKCNEGSYGVDCRCNGSSTDTKDMEKCKLNADDKMLCSGRGTCRCGKCETCNKGFSGDYCEFDDTACPRRNKKLCSNNGKCNRGRCECYSLWKDADCSCTLDKTKCITPYSKTECSRHGKCNCGKCECDKLPDKNGTYTGIYCETCDDCGEKLCKDLEDYVLCNVINDKNVCDEQYNTTDTIVKFLNKTQINGPNWNIAQYCKKRLENDSYIIFKYKYENGNMVLGIQTEHELPPKANIFIAVGSALGAVLLIGIITLIVWKILIDLHDKREYEKFDKESKANGYVTDNILYEPPSCTYRNPVCEG